MTHFRWLTAGESHGPGLTVIIDGVPAGMPLSEAQIRAQLARRQKGYGRGGRMKIETDYAHIRAGVRQGRTIGSPISLWIENRDYSTGGGPDKRPWLETMSLDVVDPPPTRVTRVRPGHADLSASLKYGYNDVRDSLERASARESAARVAAAGVARVFCAELGCDFFSHVVQIGDVVSPTEPPIDWEAVEASPVRCADPASAEAMIEAINAAKRDGDTLGGVVQARVTGVPFGLGSHVQWDRKLSGPNRPGDPQHERVQGRRDRRRLLRRRQSRRRLPRCRAPPGRLDDRPWRRKTNHAGGIEGGISNGEDIVVRVAVKPIATLAHPLPSADLDSGERVEAHYERSDVCVVPAAG